MKAAEALKSAIEAEKEGIYNYLKFAWTTENPTGKNMFIRLAMDEHEHMRILERQLVHVEAGEPWEDVAIEESIMEKVVPRIKSLRPSADERGPGRLDALDTAIKFERQASEFYARLAGEIEDTAARKILERLAGMEQLHYDLLVAERDYINGTGFWFGIPEFFVGDR